MTTELSYMKDTQTLNYVLLHYQIKMNNWIFFVHLPILEPTIENEDTFSIGNEMSRETRKK